MNFERAAKELHEHGFRVTRQRAAVLAAVEEAGCALDPAEILKLAQGQCPELGLATVYRTMEVLSGIGMIRRVHTGKGCAGVAQAKAEHGHYVICTECGRVSEFSACDVAALEEGAARETGFAITAHFVELAGMCRDCQRPSPKTRKRGMVG
jgi:Fur family transcriptional regulator, ferric uptake regulator